MVQCKIYLPFFGGDKLGKWWGCDYWGMVGRWGEKNKVGKSLDFLTFGGLVIRLGLKPRTHSLEGCCSIQLSYRTRFFLA